MFFVSEVCFLFSVDVTAVPAHFIVSKDTGA